VVASRLEARGDKSHRRHRARRALDALARHVADAKLAALCDRWATRAARRAALHALCAHVAAHAEHKIKYRRAAGAFSGGLVVHSWRRWRTHPSSTSATARGGAVTTAHAAAKRLSRGMRRCDRPPSPKSRRLRRVERPALLTHCVISLRAAASLYAPRRLFLNRAISMRAASSYYAPRRLYLQVAFGLFQPDV